MYITECVNMPGDVSELTVEEVQQLVERKETQVNESKKRKKRKMMEDGKGGGFTELAKM